MKKQKGKFNVDGHLKRILELAQNAPEPEAILAEFEKGDYSSLDPKFLEEWEIRKEKTKKKKSSKPKEKEITF